MTTSPQPLRGICTLTYWADDVAGAARWYADLLGVEPYFVRPEEGPPAYVEFRLGDRETELGLQDRRYGGPPAGAPAGIVAHWAVDDLAGTVERFVAAGAVVHQPPTVRGEGFVTASVVDPFGNVVGLMTNVHYAAHA